MEREAKLKALLDEYGASHAHPWNQRLHKLCVPLILWSLLGILDAIPGPINWAYVLAGLAFLVFLPYRNLSVLLVLAGEVVPFLILLAWARDVVGWQVWASIFAFAWVGQFVGHHLEGKRPSFFRDLFFLFVGPVWIARRFLRFRY